MPTLHHQELNDNNIGRFIQGYNQAIRHKAKDFPFENNIVPIRVAFALITVLLTEGELHGYFDDIKQFNRVKNPQLN